MEKFSFNKNPENSGNDIKSKKEKSSGLPMWFKAGVVSAGLIGSTPVFSQENKIHENNNEIELLQNITSFYEKKVQDRKNFYYSGGNNSKEDSILIKKNLEEETADYIKIANNPKEFYEQQLKFVQEIKSEIVSHFLSTDFLSKLEILNSKEIAEEKRQKLIENINNVDIIFVSPESLSETDETLAYYLPSVHKIVFPFDNLNSIIVAHELIHSAYRGYSLLNKEEINLLKKSFKKSKEISRKENKYYKNISERIDRKKQTDFYLEIIGIKKYGEKFTKEHYKKLKELEEKKMLNGEVQDFFDMTNEDQFIDIMNSIADNNVTNKPDISINKDIS